MKVWLITIGEPLPSDGNGQRLLRSGLLARTLESRGDEVCWWTSTFDHIKKSHRAGCDSTQLISDDYEIRMIRGSGYERNLSLRRLIDHRRLAQRFRTLSNQVSRPDIVQCSLPTLELCAEAVRYGKRFGIPVVLDIRDLWPDLFLDLCPDLLRTPAKAALLPFFRLAEFACREATAITGVTDAFVEWGLEKAKRSRKCFDQAFPMGYEERRPTQKDQHDARVFWSRHGVTEGQREFVMCFFGTIGRHFEIETLVGAAQKLHEWGIPIRMVLCGDGPDVEKWQRLAATCSNIVLPGWVNAAQIWTLMRMSSASLAPYVSSDNFSRSLPNKPIEYLSAGLPVLSSLDGLLAELLAKYKCGATYGNGASDALAITVRDLYQQPNEQKRMSENAVALYRGQFVAEQVYNEMGDHLRKMAREAKSDRLAA